ncbi:alpha-glucosidase [Beduini massiliensis]|uniref:alpha-glucosidase n=1 Tax=Beduini massiliensis TaxID=1585974 RepID=UPI00059AA637|nr:alpha-glucosidase [Beduini massiliensis]
MNEWWKNEVAYQIYPRSFKDTNHDGIGDIKGITEKLDYLENLGVTLLWLCPIYKSPMDDNGYDISDYYDINPEFGTMQDLEELIQEAKKKNIKIIMDLVINHTSDEHPWFKEAMTNPHSPYRDYYIFKSAKNGKAPTNWRSVFGGSVWEKVGDTEDYYFHAFSKRQPDLNWENPQMRQDLYKMINWWLEKGIAGFRVDAINFIKKDQRYQDGAVDGADGLSACFAFSRNQPGIEKFFEEMKRETFAKHHCMTVAEAVGVNYPDLGIFIGDQGCFSMMFDFNYSNFDIGEDEEWFKRKTWSPKDYRELLFTSQREIQKIGWVASFLENHDQPRSIDKLIVNKEDHNYYSKTMLAGMFFHLRGTPFIYQGQEIGMVNFTRQSIDEFNDIGSIGQYQRAIEEGYSKEEALHFVNLRSRDNTRTPMHWDDSEYAGFSDTEPWIKMMDNYKEINVANQLSKEPSVFQFYKKMIALRKAEPILVEGDFEELSEMPDDVIAYSRVSAEGTISCLCNFSRNSIKIRNIEGIVLLNNYPEYQLGELKPFQFVMIKQ